MKIKRKGISKLTDLPIPFTTPKPTIKQVTRIKRECQKIRLKGEDENSLK